MRLYTIAARFVATLELCYLLPVVAPFECLCRPLVPVDGDTLMLGKLFEEVSLDYRCRMAADYGVCRLFDELL